MFSLKPDCHSGVRQHALLNLVRMHYIRNEYVAARKVSRLVSNCCHGLKVLPEASIGSNHCCSDKWRQIDFAALHKVGILMRTYPILTPPSSILHRLPPLVSGRRPALNEIQPDLHPYEVLSDVKKLLDEQNVQAAYRTLTRGMLI